MAVAVYTRLKLSVEQSPNSDYSDPHISEVLSCSLGAVHRTAMRVDLDLTSASQTLPTGLTAVGNTLIVQNLDAGTITVTLKQFGGSDTKAFIIPALGLGVYPGVLIGDCTIVSTAATAKAIAYILLTVDSAT